MTYFDIGKSCGLNGLTLKVFCYYMYARWRNTEEQKCNDGYAGEWAIRFRDGQEYAMSDCEGRSLLRLVKIYPDVDEEESRENK